MTDAPQSSSPGDAPPPRWPDPDEPGHAVLDKRTLRAMAHPVRIRMVGMLREDGPSTATRLAEQLGLNSGATSYHLRQLAAAGFVVEDDQRGSARERWWRAVHRATLLDTDRLDPSDDDATLAYLRSVAARYAERMQQAVEDISVTPAAWKDAWDLSDYPLRLTPAELRELLDRIRMLVTGSRQDRPDDPAADAGPADARRVVLQVQAFLRAGSGGASDGPQR